MTLTEIEYGSLASSAILNSNFQFLQDKITELSALITTETSSYSSSVATLNNSVAQLLTYKEAFIPTGTIIPIQSSTIPSGYLLCDGSEIKIEDYQDLYQVIGTTYGQTDSTSFCIPNLQDKTLWGADVAKTLGMTVEAGLPNITGQIQLVDVSTPQIASSGAIAEKSTSVRVGGHPGDHNGYLRDVELDASLSSSIYGNSSTVQPPALVTNFVIKY